MDDYIQISKLNDFLYSPKSAYFHQAYEEFDTSLYHDTPQVMGNAAHETIDKTSYSSTKRYIVGMAVSSCDYKLVGKIDIYDTETCDLIERKRKVKQIHPGYVMQLVAQAVCLIEEGFEVKRLIIHSLSDNKRYFLGEVSKDRKQELAKLLESIREYGVLKASQSWDQEPHKDQNTIYHNLYF
jgi:CRISPR-associated exonuclease Cas4